MCVCVCVACVCVCVCVCVCGAGGGGGGLNMICMPLWLTFVVLITHPLVNPYSAEFLKIYLLL